MVRRRRIGDFFFLICTYDYRVSPNEFSKSVETLIDFFESDEILVRTPVHWHFPSILLERSPEKIQSRLRTRIASGIDLFLSMGYSGLPHPMLFPPEIALDMEWGILNGERGGERGSRRGEHIAGRTSATGSDEGVVDKADTKTDGNADSLLRMRASATICYPRWPDTLRNSARRIYEGTDHAILINYGSFCELIAPERSRPGTYDPVSVLQVSNFDNVRPRRLARSAAARDVAISAAGADIERAAASGSLQRFLHELTRRGKRRIARLTDLLTDESRLSGPVVKSRRGRAGMTLGILDSLRYAPIRYRREDIVQATRTVGGINAAFWERRFSERSNLLLEADVSRVECELPERILVSDMSGSVVLAGDRICCQFDAGQLTEIRGEVPAVLLSAPSATLIKGQERVEHFTVESAFSFDERDMRGLQERLICRSTAFREPIRVNLDTFFIDTAETLFMSIAIEFPEAIPGRELSEIHPLVLQLETDLDDAFLTTRFLDGERNEIRPTESTGFQCFWTAGLEFPTSRGSLHLFTPEGATVSVEHVLIRRLDRSRFELSLGGTNARESAIDLAGKKREWLWCLEILRPGQIGSSLISKDSFDRLAESYDLNVTSPA